VGVSDVRARSERDLREKAAVERGVAMERRQVSAGERRAATAERRAEARSEGLARSI